MSIQIRDNVPAAMRNGAHGDASTKPAVLVLTGIGLTAAVALRPIASLRPHFQVLAAPLAPAGNLPVMTAEDAVVLLDGAGAAQAHVIGFSFGGVIAQEIAIRYPRRVSSLVLGSSSAGGELYVSPEPAMRDFVSRLSDLPAEEGLWATVPYLYAAATRQSHAPLIGEDIAQRLRWPLDPRSYRVQRATTRARDAAARLAQITAPTLVVHGEQDRVLPLDNGRLLAEAIAGAQFVALPGGAHAFPTDVPDASQAIVKFLRAQSRQREGPAPTHNARAGRA
jgi:pimeloyl-ACP methyl ester carboxylesterase